MTSLPKRTTTAKMGVVAYHFYVTTRIGREGKKKKADSVAPRLL
jgi:hypothetical protein